MSDRLAEIAARADRAANNLAIGMDGMQLAVVDVPWLLAEIKQRNEALAELAVAAREILYVAHCAVCALEGAEATEESVTQNDATAEWARRAVIRLGVTIDKLDAALAGVGCTDTEPQAPEFGAGGGPGAA